MQKVLSSPPKPISELWRPELTCLPRLTFWRRLFRRLVHGSARLLVFICTRPAVYGLENYPRQGPALVVTNHLGDPDPVLEIAFWPVIPEAMAKIELYNIPILGWIMENLGVIWVHRGQADRRAIQAALQGLREGRIIGIAPEGRESLTGGLEEGTGGAAYLALKVEAPIVPVTLTGTETWRVYGNLKKLHRTPVTLTVGRSFRLTQYTDWRESIRRGTRQIMEALARQLPDEYRGIYRSE